jgi:primase-polymerase (primpol)-like protein
MLSIRENIPPELAALAQFVLWRFESRDGKVTKVPYTFMGYRASVTNPEHWTTLECALKFAAQPRFCDGIGFVFSPDDGLCGIDLDDIWRSDADEGAPWGMEILERFGDTYLEESPSGCGVKIWCRAKLSCSGRSWPVEHGAIEIYDRGRFFTVTGRSGPSRRITDHQSDVDLLIGDLSGGTVSKPVTIGEKIPYGTQHHTLVSLAGTMWRRGMTIEAIEAALQVVNAQQCEKPGPPENIHKIARSAVRWSR